MRTNVYVELASSNANTIHWTSSRLERSWGDRYKNLCRKPQVVFKKITLYYSTANTNQLFGSAGKKEKQTKITQVTKGK